MKIFFLLFLIPYFTFTQYPSDSLDLLALRESDNFSKPYRILKTTLSDESLFKINYAETKMTLDYVLRYHFYTAIDLNAKKNQLISMDGTTFDLSSKNAKEITDELILLVSKMYFGKKEFKNFKKVN
jgi:hypothetical protein